MKTLYVRKSGASVLRVRDASLAEVSLPGYPQPLVLDLANPEQVAPGPLTTLQAVAGAKGDLYLTPEAVKAHGIVPDVDGTKIPQWAGGSYAEQWRIWSHLTRLDARGPVADGLAAIRDEMMESLAVPAAHLASGQAERARAGLDAVAAGDSAAARGARSLLAPAHRSDVARVASVLQCAVSGILAGAC
jgi:hypothetical protein